MRSSTPPWPWPPAKAIREADPQATLIGPASSGFPWEFLETFLKSGVLEYLDGVSVHPYRSPQPAARDRRQRLSRDCGR